MSSKINVLFIGDIVGLTGLEMTLKVLKNFQEKYQIDLTIANGENVTEGKGVSDQDANLLFNNGVDIITGGNHLWDRAQTRSLLTKEKRLLRPLNYPSENPGYGYYVIETKSKVKVGVVNLQGRVFMSTIDCPFKSADWAVSKINDETKIIIVDFHAEATAEKLALSYYLDGKVSAVIGTHTHIQTADERILPKGTAYITDVGMTGPYASVVGLRKEVAIKRFITQVPYKYEPASDDMHFCAVVVQIDTETAKAVKIERITYPEFVTEVK